MRARGVEGWGKGVFFLAVSQESLSLLVSSGVDREGTVRGDSHEQDRKRVYWRRRLRASRVSFWRMQPSKVTLAGAGTAMSSLTTIPLLSGNWWS